MAFQDCHEQRVLRVDQVMFIMTRLMSKVVSFEKLNI